MTLPTTPLFRKLNLKDHDPVVILEAPGSFLGEVEALRAARPEAVIRTGLDDPGADGRDDLTFVLVFATTQAQLDRLSRAVVERVRGDAVVWFAYPKKSSKRLTCEFDRDSGWNVLGEAGFEPVRQVAVDQDWSALRFRRVEHIERLTRDPSRALSPEGRARARGAGS